MTAESCYILGLIWADGYLGKNNTVSITCVREDLELLDCIFSRTGNWAIYYRYQNKENRKPQQTFTVSDRILFDFLVSKGYKEKSGGSAANILEFIPKVYHRYWWRGYFDGDGCIYTGKNYKLFFTSTVKQDWSFVTNFFKQFNWKEVRKETLKGSYSRILLTRKSEILDMLSYIYEGFQKDRIGFSRKFVKLDSLRTPKPTKFWGKGYYLHKPTKKWRVRLKINRLVRDGGYFKTEEDAQKCVERLRYADVSQLAEETR